MLVEHFIENPLEFAHLIGYERLTPLHGQWIKDAWFSNGNFVLLAHRGSYKTTAISVVGAMLYLFVDWEARILLLRKSEDDACSILWTIAQKLESAAMRTLYQDVYGVHSIRGKRWNTLRIDLSTKKNPTKEGSLEAAGLDSSYTGKHFKIINADDVVTKKDRYSRAERERTKNTMAEMRNIKDPGGRIIVNGTTWHPEDIFQKDWIPDQKFPIGTVDVKDLDSDEIEEMKKQGKSLYSCNFKLKHVADEDRDFGDIKYAPWIETLRPVGWLDAAYSGDNLTAFALAALSNPADKESDLIVRGWAWRKSVVHCYDKIGNLARKYRASKIYYETNADKGLGMTELKKRFHAIIGKHATENKHARIVSSLKPAWPRIYFAEDSDDEDQMLFISLVAEYAEDGGMDDPPDALAGAVGVARRGRTIQSLGAGFA